MSDANHALAALNSLQGAAETLDVLWGGDPEATRRDVAIIRRALEVKPHDRATQWQCSDCGIRYEAVHACTVTKEWKFA